MPICRGAVPFEAMQLVILVGFFPGLASGLQETILG
jgi:hypothetical protein